MGSFGSDNTPENFLPGEVAEQGQELTKRATECNPGQRPGGKAMLGQTAEAPRPGQQSWSEAAR